MADAVEPGKKVRIASTMKPWRPVPFNRGRSPFNFEAAERRALGRKHLSQALFDHPYLNLALNAGATVLAAAATAKFDGFMRILAWGVLVGAGSQTLLSIVRAFGDPAPARGVA